MIVTDTPLRGAFVIEPELERDERGFFARTWCERDFAAHGLDARPVQCSVSFSERAGTLRGLHYQAAPFEEVKIVRCINGAVFDVIVDLRPDSPTLARHFHIVLSAANRTMLYVPQGFAHGFQTLEDASEVEYQISEFYRPDAARGVRWNDPAFGIRWPAADRRIMSHRDQNYPDFSYPIRMTAEG